MSSNSNLMFEKGAANLAVKQTGMRASLTITASAGLFPET